MEQSKYIARFHQQYLCKGDKTPSRNKTRIVVAIYFFSSFTIVLLKWSIDVGVNSICQNLCGGLNHDIYCILFTTLCLVPSIYFYYSGEPLNGITVKRIIRLMESK
jgi:hypothetical protein